MSHTAVTSLWKLRYHRWKRTHHRPSTSLPLPPSPSLATPLRPLTWRCHLTTACDLMLRTLTDGSVLVVGTLVAFLAEVPGILSSSWLLSRQCTPRKCWSRLYELHISSSWSLADLYLLSHTLALALRMPISSRSLLVRYYSLVLERLLPWWK